MEAKQIAQAGTLITLILIVLGLLLAGPATRSVPELADALRATATAEATR